VALSAFVEVTAQTTQNISETVKEYDNPQYIMPNNKAYF
jgi:hypothetical protein